MAEETVTITKPAPILEGSLTAFLRQIDKLGGGAIPASRFTTDPVTGKQVFKGIDTSVYDPKVAQQTQLQKKHKEQQKQVQQTPQNNKHNYNKHKNTAKKYKHHEQKKKNKCHDP